MNEIVVSAIESVQRSETAFCKFISANDAGTTGAHQSGFYISKNVISIFFSEPGVKGTNKDDYVTINWYNYQVTASRIIYYGVGSRNEYRLTRFGKGFPFLSEDNVGDLLIIAKREAKYYEAFVLNTDEDIESFFAEFNLTANETNKLIEKKITIDAKDTLLKCFLAFNKFLNKGFPNTVTLSGTARSCYNNSFNITDNFIRAHPDKIILEWLDAEYQLFKLIELEVYSETIKEPFKSVEALIEIANTILNRRKSRAGKSLEYHLGEVFEKSNLIFAPQAITEDNKKPDFIFPSAKDYHNNDFDANRLVFLAAKTTCKDRWRQVINEANRIEVKHLFTLQQGISKNQLNEMYKEGVRLVVPKTYIPTFPTEYRQRILSLENFITFTKQKQTV
ncbi:type II restriction endonuclease [Mucilaginibacter gossypii]|uniref:type II restriction endonuclease n=1 Tax=Mucilaginibacter gossypii TaxID=551996 RepID=UPI000DCF3798|nr:MULTISPECIES: type II restriction endonuclease [Mucilaginibacter]QTE35737.1 type II restriction endonuclease [Mucilaginibacter gossypii]RAV56903.1 restriction endonuclease [Mucilaginibacter rubeus]